MDDHYDRYNGMENLLGTNLAEVGTEERTVKGFPIDADLLMAKVDEQYGDRARDRIYQIIRYMPKYELPPIQPEIVRCKDCKHWREGTAFSYCDKLYGMGVLDALDYMVAEDDYCSMAERRTDERSDRQTGGD